MRLALVLWTCALAWTTPQHVSAWHRLAAGTTTWAAEEPAAIRGITVGPIESSQQPGRGYGTHYTETLLDELAARGVNWISVTPFGRIWSLSSTEVLLDFEAPYEDNRLGLAEMVAQAHRRGIRVLLIPHLWVETGGWRGEIDPGSESRWLAYQESYRRFVLAWARDAGRWGVDAFSIGVECKSWSGRFAPYWHSLIADVRDLFPGLLTYSANWDEVENVIFWDHLDLIGVNAFYPLADRDDAAYEQYVTHAQGALDNLHETAQTLQMPALLVEVGYTTRRNAAVQPWLWPDDMQDVVIDEWEQARALTALIEAAAQREWIAGVFIWRYYANLDDVSQEAEWGFSPHGKLAEQAFEAIYRQRWAADPPPFTY